MGFRGGQGVGKTGVGGRRSKLQEYSHQIQHIRHSATSTHLERSSHYLFSFQGESGHQYLVPSIIHKT
jgi:hypothetical protein